MRDVFFIPFPKKKYNMEICKRWIRLCGREDFNVEKVTRNTYICSMHFVGGNGPTADHPDPFSANQTKSNACKTRKPRTERKVFISLDSSSFSKKYLFLHLDYGG